MNTYQGSPAPWVISPSKKKGCSYQVVNKRLSEEKTHVVCEVYGTPQDDGSVNSALIAAVPEMYEALHLVVTNLQKGFKVPNYVLNKAILALSKANSNNW